MTKTCPVCNKPFEADSVYQIYCSYSCRRNGEKLRQKGRKSRTRNYLNAVKEEFKNKWIVGTEANQIKTLIGYHGSGNPYTTCEKCRHSAIQTNSSGKSLDYVRHACRKHSIQVGLYGTCSDFDPCNTRDEDHFAL